MLTRQLGSNGPIVSSMGLGCMGMTPIYANPNPEEAIATIHEAVERGVTLIDTADMYGAENNEELVGQALKGIRHKVVLASKFGNMRLPDGTRKVNGKPEYVIEACEKSLQRLAVENIGIYYLHRVDPTVPIEDTVGAMSKLVEQGKMRCIGLSEAGSETIRKAHSTHPLAAVQTEYSLASRDVEAEVLPLCRELGIGFVAYAPLSRGLLSGTVTSLDQLGETDRRRDMPRFQADTLPNNLRLVDSLTSIAKQHKVSKATIAITWALSRGDNVVPIPGCSRRETLHDGLSALTVVLSSAELAQIEEALTHIAIEGTRQSKCNDWVCDIIRNSIIDHYPRVCYNHDDDLRRLQHHKRSALDTKR